MEVGTWGVPVCRRAQGPALEPEVQSMTQRTTIYASRLWVVALLAGSAVITGAAKGQDGLMLHPQALNWAGIYPLRQIDPDLTGEGVRLGVVCRSFTYSDADVPQNDYQPNVRHACFGNARLSFFHNRTLAPGVSPHSTAICSILFGDDPAGVVSNLDPFLYQGAVPGAVGHIYEFWHFALKHIYLQEAPAIDLATASFGQALEDGWTRGIEALVEHQGLIFVASIGNGTNASDPPFYPGAGPNTIGVGVVSSVNVGDAATRLSHFALAYPQESSAGPTDDGRCKPDIIAPGNCLVAGAEGDEGYSIAGNWSSFSTPVAAGVVGLLIQKAKEDANLNLAVSPKGGSCVLKAILMSSATKLPYWHKGRLSTDDDHEAPLDHAQGAGMVNALDAHQILTAGRGKPGDVPVAGWDLNDLAADRTLQQVYRIAVDEPGDKVLTATLAWNRHYRTTRPFSRISERDNDLRLEVWAVNPGNPAGSILLDYSDSEVDNVEHIYVDTLPGYALYEIVVSYSSLDEKTQAAGERYGLAWSVDEKLPDANILWHDLNADGIVNQQDSAILMYNWAMGLRSPESYVIGDINMDGVIDREDLRRIDAYRDRRADWRTETVTN